MMKMDSNTIVYASVALVVLGALVGYALMALITDMTSSGPVVTTTIEAVAGAVE